MREIMGNAASRDDAVDEKVAAVGRACSGGVSSAGDSMTVASLSSRTSMLLGLHILLLSTVVFGQEPSQGTSDRSDGVLANQESISCQSYCSATESRVALCDISFAGLAIDPMNARLEFTVYNDGFEREAFAVFSPLLRDPEVEPQVSQPALLGIRPFDVRLVQTQSASRETLINGVTVRGLEPNVDYFWQVRYQREKSWITSELVQCPTPVCIHDAQR